MHRLFTARREQYYSALLRHCARARFTTPSAIPAYRQRRFPEGQLLSRARARGNLPFPVNKRKTAGEPQENGRRALSAALCGMYM